MTNKETESEKKSSVTAKKSVDKKPSKKVTKKAVSKKDTAVDKVKKVSAKKTISASDIKLQTVKAAVKYVRVSPYKLRKVANEIRDNNAQQMLSKLKVMPQKSATILYKLLKSGIANAVNNNSLDDRSLTISKLIVNEGPSYKRARIRARGRIFKIIKPTSHVELELTNKGVS